MEKKTEHKLIIQLDGCEHDFKVTKSELQSAVLFDDFDRICELATKCNNLRNEYNNTKQMIDEAGIKGIKVNKNMYIKG